MKGLQYWGNMVKSMLLHCEEVEVVLCFDEVEGCILKGICKTICVKTKLQTHVLNKGVSKGTPESLKNAKKTDLLLQAPKTTLTWMTENLHRHPKVQLTAFILRLN